MFGLTVIQFLFCLLGASIVTVGVVMAFTRSVWWTILSIIGIFVILLALFYPSIRITFNTPPWIGQSAALTEVVVVKQTATPHVPVVESTPVCTDNAAAVANCNQQVIVNADKTPESVVATATLPASTPTATAAPTEIATEPVSSEGGAVITKFQNTLPMGQWTVSYFTGATRMMKDFRFTDFQSGWKEFPNVDWPTGDFLAKNGLEYGQELSDFCQQDQTCDFPVAARSFRTITADYDISGIGSCKEGGTGIGCALIITNVGDVTASFRNQMVDTGHTITGLYWNGDELDQAISAWASHIVYRMVGVMTSMPANPGANCSVPNGCKGVNIRFAIISGNELLVLGETIVNPTQ